MTSCPGDTLGCLGPMDCSGTTPDCCATDVLNGMDAGAAFPHCYSQTLTTKCVAKASCSSNITVNCGTAQMPQTETLHVCTAKTDCTGDDMSNPNCCLVDNYHVCVSSLLVTLGALSCL
jgi:hypothetical protein